MWYIAVLFNHAFPLLQARCLFHELTQLRETWSPAKRLTLILEASKAAYQACTLQPGSISLYTTTLHPSLSHDHILCCEQNLHNDKLHKDAPEHEAKAHMPSWKSICLVGLSLHPFNLHIDSQWIPWNETNILFDQIFGWCAMVVWWNPQRSLACSIDKQCLSIQHLCTSSALGELLRSCWSSTQHTARATRHPQI